MTALLLALGLAQAQQFAFPSSPADHGDFYVTAYYDHGGYTDWNCNSLTYGGHRGSDFGGGSWTGMDAGRDITAAAAGVVSAVNDGEFDRCDTGTCAGGGGFGNYVYVQHADGTETIYAHLKQWSVLVSVGDEVDCGTKLGEMGSSGYSTGPHLHFQPNDPFGTAMDPFEGPCDAGDPSLWMDQQPWDSLPTLDCDTWPGCSTVDTLTCGAVIDARNDDPGSTSVNSYWGCTDFARYSGPELSWRFVTDLDEPVSVRLTGLSADLDLFAIDDFVCDGRNCNTASTNSATSDEEITFDATAGVEVALAVDGWDGATTAFHLEVLCNGQLPGATPGTTGTGTGAPTTGTGTGTGTGGTPTTDGTGTGTGSPVSEPGVYDGSKPLGCGCSGGSGAPAWTWLGLVPLLLRRRR